MAVDSHTAGEPTRVVIGGGALVKGETLWEKNVALFGSGDGLARFLTGEPRGHAATHAVLPLPPCDPRADVSLLIMSALGSLAMCGHALIGAVTSLLEIGVLPRVEPCTELMVETLAGLIAVKADVRGQRVVGVTFVNAPCWVFARDFQLEVPGLGELSLDIVYAGLWYAVLDASRLGSRLTMAEVPRLVALSHQIREHLNIELPAREVTHPGAPSHIPQLLYVGPAHDSAAHGRNLATSSQLGFDRSPCGTGSCARMALLHARGELNLGQVFVHEGILGTRFEGKLVEELSGPSGVSVVPEITGRAYITGFNQMVVDNEDPLGLGFFVPAAS